MKTLYDVFCKALGTVLAQCSGTEWKVSVAQPSNVQPDDWFPTSVVGAMQGELAFGVAGDVGPRLAQVMLATPELPTSFGAEEKEAVTELFRQVCGLAATDLRSAGGELTFSISGDAPLSWTPIESASFQLQRPEWGGSLVLAVDAVLVSAFEANECQTQQPALENAVAAKNLDLLLDVQLGVRLRFGTRRMRLREVLELHAGTVVELDRNVKDPVDLLVGSKLVGRGEVVIVEGNYGLRVSEIVNPLQRIESLY